MRSALLALGLVFVLALPAAHAQAPTWTGAAQPTNPTPNDGTVADGRSLAIDAAGNQYLAGALINDGGSGAPAVRAFGSTSLSGGAGLASGFVAKLSPSQQWLWAVRASGNGEGLAFQRVAVSPAGDTYAVGIAQDDFSTAPSGGTVITVGAATYTTTRSFASFMTRLNASGQPLWLAGASGAGIVATGWDATAGNLVVAGSYQGTVSLGTVALPAAPAGGIFVARLSAAGQWLSATGAAATGATGTNNLTVYSAAVGSQGQVALNFRLRRAGLTLGSTALTSGSDTDAKVAVAQLSAAGQWQWVTQPTNAGSYYSNDLEYDRNGSLWVLGDASQSALQLGTGTVANGEEFVARLSAAGQWDALGIIGLAGGSSPGFTSSLAVDGQGNAVVAGQLDGAKTFGTTTLTPATGGSGNDRFVARYGAGGQWQYAQLAPTGAGGDGYGFNAIALDGAGHLFATGSIRGGSVTFGATTLANPSLTGSNVFVARLSNAGQPLAARQAADAPRLALYPNPVAAGLAATLRLPAPTKAARPVMLRDALGRLVRTVVLAAGQQQISLPTTGLSPGLYQVETGLSRAQVIVE